MISLIYGGKGSGKTAALVALANGSVKNAKGFHIYVDKNNSRMHDLDHDVKLVDASEYGIANADQFLAFVKGMVAINYDIEKIYIDNICKIISADLSNVEPLFDGIAEISKLSGADFAFTIPAEKSEMPEFLQKYL